MLLAFEIIPRRRMYHLQAIEKGLLDYGYPRYSPGIKRQSMHSARHGSCLWYAW